jgi:hypothetical protein
VKVGLLAAGTVIAFSGLHEGSRSCKAIAFINSKGNIRLAETYSEPCMFPQRKTAFSATGAQFWLDVSADSKIGEELWKK